MAVAGFLLDDKTVVRFEVDDNGFRPVGADGIVGRLESALDPVLEGAKLVIDRVRVARPRKVEVSFGIKVSGGGNWIVARAATEANFSVTLSWEDPIPPGGTAPPP